MAENHNEYNLRKSKIQYLLQHGINPYPSSSDRSITVGLFLDSFEDLYKKEKQETLTGRIRLKRIHGKVSFYQLEDESGKIQAVFSEKDLGEKQYSFQKDYLDVGDIMQITGVPFVTQKGENSLLVQSYVILTKSVRQLPDKWHGIQDEEERYRRRYLDMLMRPELREMFYKKSVFWYSMRTFLRDEGFLEVETPVLESTPGGADATPFSTHHNALNIDLFLRISMGELWQKRLMVAGFEKTFEIGRQFRNEGLSAEHLQDYTQMEFYWAYADYIDGMKLVERMYKHCIMQTFHTLQFTIKGFTIDFDQPWKKIDYVLAVYEGAGIDITSASDDELKKKCIELGITLGDTVNRARIIDSLWKYCRKSIGGPAFLVNHPVEVSPLSKRQESNQNLVQRFQVLIAGSEQGNGYSELNDPIDQAKRFEEQTKLREAGDTEAQMHDRDFVEALEYGMPPTCGFGVSERLFSFLMDKPIKECVMFPLLRPKQPAGVQHEIKEEKDDRTLSEFDAGMTREEARVWMLENIQDENLRRHMFATEVLMRKLAEHFEAKEVEAWGIAGLLHDIDYEQCTIEEHSLVGAKMLEERNVHQDIVNAVREHNFFHRIEPKTKMSKALMCLEQLTGLIIACTFVQPDKKIASVKAKSVKKKFKDKSFAKGVIREEIQRSEELLGLTLDESIVLCLEAMQGAAKELGLD